MRRTKQTGITLEVGQRLRADATLQVGEVTNTVEVTSEISRVQTESSSLGTSSNASASKTCRSTVGTCSIS
ncbi:MAG: hypothetical protein U0Y68_24325 [Blastocatellia bacterium]